MYGVKGSATVLQWVKIYKKYGISGLITTHYKSIYTVKDKLNILNWMKMNKSSYPETAFHFDIKSPSSIWNWQLNFEKYGVNCLLTQGDRKIMANRKNDNLTGKDKELAKIKEANLMLKIENDFLKN